MGKNKTPEEIEEIIDDQIDLGIKLRTHLIKTFVEFNNKYFKNDDTNYELASIVGASEYFLISSAIFQVSPEKFCETVDIMKSNYETDYLSIAKKNMDKITDA